MDGVRFTFIHIICGAGFSFLVPVIMALIAGSPSQIREHRKLPFDSYLVLLSTCTAIGFIAGLAFAANARFDATANNFPQSILVGIATGFLIPLFFTTQLNNQYLARAQILFEQQNFAEAIEDASEVVRSSSRLREEAENLIQLAKSGHHQPVVVASVSPTNSF